MKPCKLVVKWLYYRRSIRRSVKFTLAAGIAIEAHWDYRQRQSLFAHSVAHKHKMDAIKAMRGQS